jgi:hypothetical protein
MFVCIDVKFVPHFTERIQYEEDDKYINNSGLKIHLKDIDDGALHFCILFLWTLSIVPVF